MKINKAMWLGIFIGGLYALIPTIHDTIQGKMNAIWLFFPVKILFKIIITLMGLIVLLTDQGGNRSLLLLSLWASKIFGIIFWALIGGLIGMLIHRIKNKTILKNE